MAEAADRDTLIRRVTLALTGLPPTLQELDTDETYAQVVDRLLASPHFGEHLAVGWLDHSRPYPDRRPAGVRPRKRPKRR